MTPPSYPHQLRIFHLNLFCRIKKLRITLNIPTLTHITLYTFTTIIEMPKIVRIKSFFKQIENKSSLLTQLRYFVYFKGKSQKEK